MTRSDCKPRIDWFGLGAGFALFATGIVLSMTLVGAFIGVPLLLASLSLLTDVTTLRGTPCAK